jgi:8-oxo-dGTP diphosphatase
MDRRTFSVAIFARHAGRVLLVAHERLGTWLPVGGELEPGETPLEAARRELREETGLEGTFTRIGGVDGSPPGLIGYEEHGAGSKGLHMNFAFVADVESDVVVSNGEFGEHAWVTDSAHLDAPRNVHELVRLALRGPDVLVALAERWLAAFNAKDLDALLALYEPCAVHTSPKLRDREPATKGQIRGVGALRAWWADAMQRLPGLRYEPLHLMAMGDRVIMEYRRTNPGEPDLLVAEVLIVSARGAIAESRVYHG